MSQPIDGFPRDARGFRLQGNRRPLTLLLGVICLLVGGCGPSEEGSSDKNPSGYSSSSTSKSEGDRAGAESSGSIATRPRTPTPSLSAVRRAFEEGRTADALKMAQTYLLANPNHPEALFVAAQSLAAEKEVEQAIETMRLVPPGDADFGLNALGAIADWTVALGMPAEAEATFRTIIEKHGDLPLAHSRIAMLLNSQGKRAESVPHLVKLASLQDITGRELGAMVTIADQCAVEKIPGTTGTDDDPVEGDLRRARRMAMVQDWDESLALTENLRDKFPDSTAIAAFLGTLYITLQKTDELGEWVESLPTGIEQQPEYWTTLARWLEFQGRYEEAIRCSCESVSRDPTNPDAYETFARVLQAVGDTVNAEEADERARRLTSVRDDYHQTFVSEPTAADYVNLGSQLLTLHRPWEALGWIKQANKLDPNDPSIKDLAALLQEYEAIPDRASWLLCGVDREKYKLPDQLRSLRQESNPSLSDGSKGIELTDVARQVGLDFQYETGNQADDGSYLLYHTMGGGIGVLDFDRDGSPDLYFSQGGGDAFADNNSPNALYRNLGGESFADVSAHTDSSDRMYGQGVTAADFNQDGFIDLIVANIGENRAFRNNGDGTFTQISFPSWAKEDRWSSAVACADINGDGLVDMVECNYIDDPESLTTRCTETEQLCRPSAFNPATDRVLLGQADGAFASSLEVQPLEDDPAYSLGVIIANIDGEPGNEVFIANDTVENALWFGSHASDSGESRFTQEARLRGCATGPLGTLLGCMGIATGDFDHNGTFDMYVTNYYNEPSNLYLQQDAGLFVDNAALYRARESSLRMVGFGTQAADLQRDGWLDLVVLNGHAVDRRSQGEPFEMLPQLFRGGPGQLTVEDQNSPFWQRPALGRTLAMLDWNRDGRPDMVGNHLDQPVALLQNESTPGHWLEFLLVGTESERDAVGAKVVIESGDRSWTSWVTAGDGYFCSNEPVVDFGIGDLDRVDRVTITWTSGQSETIESPQIDRRHLVIEGSGETFSLGR